MRICRIDVVYMERGMLEVELAGKGERGRSKRLLMNLVRENMHVDGAKEEDGNR